VRDSRIDDLAALVIDYSVQLGAGEKVLIECIGLEIPLAKALIRRAYAAGGQPYLSIKDHELLGALFEGATEEQMTRIGAFEADRMREMDAYVGIRAGQNTAELSGVASDKLDLYQRLWWEPVHGRVRVPETKWCVMRYPNHAMAQMADMSVGAFEDFYFRVCTLDYPSLSRAMDALVDRMVRTSRVRIKGPGTDLSFSIEGLPAIKCAGLRNLPDGEVFTAPVRDSVEGVIVFNTTSHYMGTTFSDIELTFERGRIVRATSNRSERMEEILDTDEGARYIGEFSLGLNPYIAIPMNDTLFDEKIRGSFHFTPGSAYQECDNGNRSAVHWDLVSIQRPEYGGGEIRFDDTLIRTDGLFVTEDLEGLNPDRLIG
jgi:aminopeptidase